MSKGPKVTFPDPIDPRPAIQEQGTQNLDAAIATALLNQVNQVGPGGSTIFSQTGDVTNIGGREIPQFQQTTTLDPVAQQQFDLSQQLGLDITGLAGQNVGAVAEAQGTPFSLEGLPGQVSGIQPGSLNFQGAGQVGLDLANLPGVRQDFAQQGRELEQATFAQTRGLLDPIFQEQNLAADVRLSERGLPVGSQAESGLLSPLRRSQNLALQQAASGAVAAGRQEQGRLFGQQQQQRGQAFGEALSGGQFGQAEAGRLFGQGLAGQQTAFSQALTNANLQNQARQQGIQEQAFQRSLPINEIAALLGTAPGVQVPSFIQTPGVGVQAPDVIGATLGAGGLNLQNAQAQQQAAASGLGGLFGLAGSLGSAAIPLLSDIRKKRDIRRIGTWKDFDLFSFRYVGEFVRKIGVMAQDVEKLIPEAVIEFNGMKHVNYGAI